MTDSTTIEQPVNPAAPPGVQRIMRSTLVVMFGFMAAKGISLIQAVIIANRFGAGAEYDAFTAANQIPFYVVRLIGGGALGVAFIPLFSALLNEDNIEGAWRLASQVFNTLMILTLGLSILVVIFAPILTDTIVAPGFDDDKAALTVELMRILSISGVLFSLSGLLSGVLHGHNHFFLPVLAPVFQDIGFLLGVIFLTGPMGIHGLAWGILIGAIFQLSVQIPGLMMFKFEWKPILGWHDPMLRKVVRLMLPRISIAVAFMVNLIAIGNVNSRLGDGAVSAFDWGLRFMDIPQALLGTAIAVVIFPTLSALSSTGQSAERSQAFINVLRFMLVTTIPAAAGLVLVSYPALRILFDEYEAARIFTVIQVISLAIIIQSLHEVFTRAFYAQQDTYRPMIYSWIATGFTVTWIFFAYQVYRATDPPLWSPLAVGGPALGYVIAFTVEMILLNYNLQKDWGDIGMNQLRQTMIHTLALTALMVVVTLIVDQILKGAGLWDYVDKKKIIIRVGLLVAAGGGTFLIGAWFTKLGELRELITLVRQRGQQVISSP